MFRTDSLHKEIENMIKNDSDLTKDVTLKIKHGMVTKFNFGLWLFVPSLIDLKGLLLIFTKKT